MTVNYADKFEKKVEESFVINSLTQNAINHDYDFMGVDTIKVYSVGTVEMTNYTPTGSNRYGDATELSNTVQTMKLTQDRAFRFTIDRKNNQDTNGTIEVGRALKRQIEERVIPEIDKYRLKKIITEAKANSANYKVTAKPENAYSDFLDGVTHLLDNGIPMAGAFAYISSDFYKAIRKDPSFIQPSDMAQEMRLKGVVGMVEGIPLVHVPTSYFPTDFDSNKKVNFLIMNKAAVLGAEKLVDYKVHDNPPGINGWLVEGRLRYDAFILDKKKGMLYLSAKDPS